MSWFNTEGSCPQYYIWSKTRYIRNISGFPFHPKESDQLAEFNKKMDELLKQNGFRKEVIPKGKTIEVLSLGEKQFADGDFIDTEGERALYLNEPCNLSIAIGGRDMISIQSILSGLAITESMNIAAGAEELLDNNFEIAYSDKYGYLSPDPHKCGSGAELCAALYLPALSAGEQIEKERNSCRELNIGMAPFSLYQQNPGNIYLISQTISANVSETDERQHFDKICQRIVQNEKNCARMIFKNKSKLIIDKAWRAFGTLRYAKQLGEIEFLSLLSDLRLALSLTDDKSLLPPISFITLNYLLAEGLNASVALTIPAGERSEENCLTARADLVSEQIRSAKGSALSSENSPT